MKNALNLKHALMISNCPFKVKQLCNKLIGAGDLCDFVCSVISVVKCLKKDLHTIYLL